MPRPDLGLAFAPTAPIDPPPARAIGSRPPGVPHAAPPDTGVRDGRRRPRRIPLPRARARPVAMVVDEPRLALDVDDFHELRRLGLFDDCGRNPPPSWWAR